MPLRPAGVSPHPAARILLVAAAVGLGHALQIANGFYDERAIRVLTVALLLTIAAVALPRRAGAAAGDRGQAMVFVALVIGIGWQLLALLETPPLMYMAADASLEIFKGGVLVLAALTAAGASRAVWFRHWWFPAALGAHAALGWWTLVASPSPAIDVVVVHRAAIEALMDGRNPYQITFANIYGPGSPFYNPEAVAGDRVLFGYPYPPLSLLLAVPGHLLAGDYRYAQLAALSAGAALLGSARPSLNARLAAVLLLTTPRVFFVLEQGWTEPLAVCLLGLLLFAVCRVPRLLPWAAGLLLVAKQYLLIATPLVWRQLRAEAASDRAAGALDFKSGVARTATAALAVTLPFAIWHLPAFVDHVVLLQTREPFRIDSLSYLSWAARAGLGEGSFIWAGLAAAAGLAFSFWRTPATAGGLASSLALATFVTFAFGSKAFCNYYFFVIGALCYAAAVGDEESPSRAA